MCVKCNELWIAAINCKPYEASIKSGIHAGSGRSLGYSGLSPYNYYIREVLVFSIDCCSQYAAVSWEDKYLELHKYDVKFDADYGDSSQ